MRNKQTSDLASICQVCLYYKGETEPNFNSSTPEGQNASQFWYYEKAWAEDQLRQDHRLYQSFLSEYLAAGLSDFESLDGTPVGLKAVLFNRYMHWGCGSPEDFKRFYLTKYKGLSEAECLAKLGKTREPSDH